MNSTDNKMESGTISKTENGTENGTENTTESANNISYVPGSNTTEDTSTKSTASTAPNTLDSTMESISNETGSEIAQKVSGYINNSVSTDMLTTDESTCSSTESTNALSTDISTCLSTESTENSSNKYSNNVPADKNCDTIQSNEENSLKDTNLNGAPPLVKDMKQPLPLVDDLNRPLPLDNDLNKPLPLVDDSNKPLPLDNNLNKELPPLDSDLKQPLPLDNNLNDQLPLSNDFNNVNTLESTKDLTDNIEHLTKLAINKTDLTNNINKDECDGMDDSCCTISEMSLTHSQIPSVTISDSKLDNIPDLGVTLDSIPNVEFSSPVKTAGTNRSTGVTESRSATSSSSPVKNTVLSSSSMTSEITRSSGVTESRSATSMVLHCRSMADVLGVGKGPSPLSQSPSNSSVNEGLMEGYEASVSSSDSRSDIDIPTSNTNDIPRSNVDVIPRSNTDDIPRSSADNIPRSNEVNSSSSDEVVSRSRGQGDRETEELRELVAQLQSMLSNQLLERERLQAANERLTRELAGTESGARGHGGENSGKGGDRNGGKIEMLEATIKKQRKELDAASVTISNLQASGKKDRTAIQAEHQAKLNAIKKQVEDLQKEKESLVVRYAQTEQRNLELSDRASRSDAKLAAWSKEREIAVQKFNNMKSESIKAAKLLETKELELAGLRKELEYHKELAASGDVQVKFHHGRLKDEQEAQKELKARLDDLMLKSADMSGDWEMIKEEFSLVRRSQQVGHLTVTLAALQKVKSRLETELQPKAREREEVITLALKELLHSVESQINLVEEIKICCEKVTQLESGHTELNEVKVKVEQDLKNLQQELENKKQELSDLEIVKSTVEKLENELAELKEKNKELEQTEEDMQADRQTYKQREEENLEFTQRITNKNSLLQSENITLRAELVEHKKRSEDLQIKSEQLEQAVSELTSKLTVLEQSSSEQINTLTQQLTTQTNLAVECRQKAADAEDELKTTRRQNSNIVKDLTRQLQSVSRRCESDSINQSANNANNQSINQSINDNSDRRSLGRGDSDSSLDSTANGVTGGGAWGKTGSNNRPIASEENDCPTVEVVEIDRRRLLDKIISLQKSQARKTEKIDFLEDHVRHLSEEVQKKSKILLYYVQREETGVLSSEDSDRVKAQITSRGGIMASLYSTQALDGSMTVDLALQISRQLQNVLEDALLKNITLKENLETLGHQVAKLSEQNSALQQNIAQLSSELKLARRSKANTS